MRISRIPSSDLPSLARPVRECINHGLWTLFRSDQVPEDPNVAYHIKGHASVYHLNAVGEVIHITEGTASPAMDEILYFTDVPSPPLLSEGRRCRSSGALLGCCDHSLEGVAP